MKVVFVGVPARFVSRFTIFAAASGGMDFIMDFLVSMFNSLPGVAAEGLFYGIFALGVYITYKILDVADLTVDGSIVTGCAVTTICILYGVDPLIAVFIAFIVGMLAGALTGFFHTFLKIPAILAGILSQFSLYTINMIIMGLQAFLKEGGAKDSLIPMSPTAYASVSDFSLIVSSRDKTSAMLVGFVFVAAIIALLYWFFGTEFGCSLRATGANPKMARAQGINTSFATVFGLMFSNGFVALAGGLLAQYTGGSNITFGAGAIVIGLASVVIGEVLCNAIFKKGASFAVKLVFVVLGSLVYSLIKRFVINIGLDTNFLKLISAVIVAIFLSAPNFKAKSLRKVAKKGA